MYPNGVFVISTMGMFGGPPMRCLMCRGEEEELKRRRRKAGEEKKRRLINEEKMWRRKG